MKRKIAEIVAVLLTVLIILGGVLVTRFEEIVDWKQIYDDRLTEQEQIDFESQLGSKTYYYYHNLNEKQKQAYIMMYSMFKNFAESRRIEITAAEVKKVFIAVLYDNCEIFWVDANYEYNDYGESVRFMPEYRIDKEESAQMAAELDEKIDEIVLSAEKFTTDYEKELYFHDQVCEATVYDVSTHHVFGDTAYSSLIQGRAICEGYSRAMQILLDEAGINNYLVTGDGKTEDGTEGHMWNVVEIDGKNYHLDATWNDDTIKTEYIHLYFNVTDEYISKDHINLVPDENNCSYNDANYFEKNSLYVDSFTGFDSLVVPVSDVLEKGNNNVEMLFADEKTFNSALEYIENGSYTFFNFVELSVEESGRELQTDEVEYIIIRENNYLCLIFEEG